MKKALFFTLFFLVTTTNAQVAHYNQYPVLQTSNVLEDLTDISFAYSFRLLIPEYQGALVRLRRNSDNTESDFYATGDDKVDIDAINVWRAGANVFMVAWYDQSGLDRHAIQPNTAFQPQFIPSATQPYFAGDGSNDRLVVPENFQNLTENGKNGTVLGVFYATDRADSAFGVLSGRERWLVHINWSNERCFFDPGYCCNGPRSFVNNLPMNTSNPGSLTIWDQYTFVRRDDPNNSVTDRTIMRLGGVEKVNGGFPDSQSCNLTFNFGIGATISNSGDTTSGNSNTRFSEMIMYRVGKDDSFLQAIEENQINFWNL